MSRAIQLGNTTVVVESSDFVEGYQVGYSWFIGQYDGTVINEAHIYAMLAVTINSVRHSSNYNAGYICGWMIALHEKEDGLCVLSSLLAQVEDEPLTFFGPVEEAQL